jgi:DNA-binding response OmpR family regulator
VETSILPSVRTAPVVLYVEDDPSTARLFTLAARDANCSSRIFLAKDGDVALAFLNHEAEYREAPRPDLVVLDVNLPSRSGFEVLQCMQRMEHTAEIPVILFTSSDLESDRTKALKMGARGYLHKPNDFEGFWSAVDYICGEAAATNSPGPKSKATGAA